MFAVSSRSALITIPIILATLFGLSTLLTGAVIATYYNGETSSASLVFRYGMMPLAGIFLVVATWKHENLLNPPPCSDPEQRNKITVLISAGIYVALLYGLKAAKLTTLHYELFDAGLYANKLWRISHALGSDAWRLALFEGHFQPISMAFAALYALNDDPLPVYFVQTALLASGVWPLYKIASRQFPNSALPVWISFAYLLNPTLQFNDILGFHPDQAILPALLWGFWFTDEGRPWLAIATGFVAVLVGEAWIPVAAFYCLYAGWRCERKWMGILASLTLLFIFLWILFYALPRSGSESSGETVFLSGDLSPYGKFLTGDLSNFHSLFLDPRKAFFILFLLAPLGLSPLLGWRALLVSIPEWAKTLLSSEPLHYAVEGHYTPALLAILSYSHIRGLSEIRRRFSDVTAYRWSRASVVLTITLAISHSPTPLSFDFWTRWSAGNFMSGKYQEDSHTESLRKVSTIVGSNPDLKVEVTNGAFTPQLANRWRYELFPSAQWQKADIFIIDKVIFKGAGAERAQLVYGKKAAAVVQELRRIGSVLYEDPHFVVYTLRP